MVKRNGIKGRGIYKFTNLINGKIYVGVSTHLARRFSEHRCNYKKYPISCAIRKYGWENFEVEILEYFNNEDSLDYMFEREIYWITYFNSTERYTGYNLANGGKNSLYGHICSEETRLKISKASKGRKHSQESKNKIAEWSRNRRHSEETKRKMSESCKKKSRHI